MFTLAEAAHYLGRTTRAVEHLIDRGAIQVTKLDGKRQIDKAELDKLIERKEALTQRLQRFLAETRAERRAIENKLATVLATGPNSDTEN